MTTKISRYTYIVLAAISILAAASSCSGVKNLKKPALDIPAETVKGYSDSLSYSDLQWWEYYTAPSLKSLIARALENNRDILKAAAKV